MATERKKFKDWYDRELVDAIAGRFSRVAAGFDRDRFVSAATDSLDKLEMMDRVRQISAALDVSLRGDTRQRMRALIETMEAPAGEDENITDNGYIYWPYGEFIGATGLGDWDASFEAMVELTQRLTAEFAVRPFLEADIDETFRRLTPLLNHPSFHVRRWVSEGTRTRLPWASAVKALQSKQEERIAFLDHLKDDESLYVRRSVANHLQDILKDDTDRGIEVLSTWSQHESEGVAWVCKHAARGLLKAGDPRVMALFGYHAGGLDVREFSAAASSYRIGDTLELNAKVANTSTKPRLLRVDWVLDRPTTAGNRSEKVFRWKDVELDPGEVIELDTSFALVHRSTRELAVGEHRATLRLNGADEAELRFMVEVAS